MDARAGDGIERLPEDPCSHSELEFVGYDRDTVFLRCPGCGSVFVRQGNRTWKVPRRKQATAS